MRIMLFDEAKPFFSLVMKVWVSARIVVFV